MSHLPTPEHVLTSQHGILFYENNISSTEDMIKHGCTFSHLEWPSWAWPGGYPLVYFTRDGGCLCPSCANENINLTLDKDYDQWCIVAQEINYEEKGLICDNCYADIPAAYGDDDEEHES